MKSPIDTVKGRITDYDPRTQEVTIKAVYQDWPILVKRQYKECLVQMIDGRRLSDKQRRTCYALLREISNYSGMGLDPTKEQLKIKFLSEELQQTADQIFSLSTAPMSLVCAFERFLVNFIVDWDIPCSFPLLDFVDDTGSYIYACLAAKRCCICGKPSDLHHCDGSRVGTGRNREEIVHEGLEALPLCRVHHNECHNIGQAAFNERYHIDHGVRLDKHLCKLYRLKRNEENENAESSDRDGTVCP